MHKKIFHIIISLIILSIFISPLVTSISDLGTFKKGSCIELPQTCATCTFANLTQITNTPNSQEFLTEEVNMTKTGNRFTFEFCNTTLTGNYIVDGFGDPNGVVEIFNYKLEVTNSGILLSTSESIVYVVLIFMNLLAFIFFLYFAVTLPYSNKTNPKTGSVTRITKSKYIKLFAALFAYGSFLWFFTIFTGILNNFVSLSILTNVISNLYVILLVIGSAFTLFIFIVFMIEIWKDILHWEQIKKFGESHG